MRQAARAMVYATLFTLTAGLRFLAIQSLSNDHYVHLTGAQQILFGDLPVRDFVDAGTPLMFVASAAAQAVLGHTLFAEAVLIAVMFGLGAALTAAAVRELTGSLAAGVVAAVYEVAIFPRTYGYQKVIACSLCFYLFGRYVSRPDRRRIVLIAAAVATTFLLRHDNGVYLGVGALLTVVLCPWPIRPSEAARRSALLVACIVAMLLPYFVYLQMFDGIVTYFRHGLDFTYRMALRQPHVWPNPFAERTPETSLLYVFHVIPLMALAWLVVNRNREDIGTIAPRVVPLVAVAILSNLGLLRAPLAARVPDAVTPAAVLGAWLIARAFQSPRRAILIPLSASAALVAGLWIAELGSFVPRVRSIGVVGQWGRTRERFVERAAELRERFNPHQLPTHAVAALMPFFAYLDRCTTVRDRLFVAGYIPEVPYYAQRPFAGGAYLRENYATIEDQQRLVDRIQRQEAPFALVPSDYAEDLRLNFPIVSGFLTSQYAPLTDVVADDSLTVRILLSRAYASAPKDSISGWPCVLKQRPASIVAGKT